MKNVHLYLAAALAWAACQPAGDRTPAPAASITETPFGMSADGPVSLYTLRNGRGMEARITNYGGTLTHLIVPDRDGNPGDVTLGFDSLADYIARSPHFGCIVGRYANRIGGARFTLDGQTYSLAANNNGQSLHGGLKGFDKVRWTARPLPGKDTAALELTYHSPDGEEGYPGTLDVKVVYLLTPAHELIIRYAAVTDKPTVCNLTHHAYFNLAGAGNGTILDHQLMLNAAQFTPVDSVLIPTGGHDAVAGTPFDFRTPVAIGARIDADHPQLRRGAGGYDHNWVLDRTTPGLTLAATVYEPVSGRVMEVLTEEPGIQVYTGNFLDGTLVGKGGKAYPRRSGFCLETQHFPDSPNQPDFPSTVLRPGETYQTQTVYRFSVR